MELKMQSIAYDAKSTLVNEFFGRDTNQLQKDYSSILEINVPKKNYLYRPGNRCSYLFWIKTVSSSFLI